MYTIFATVLAAIVGLTMTAVTITRAPADEASNMPPMHEIKWGSDEPMSSEAEYAIKTFFVCEYTDRGHAAMTELRDTLGALSLTSNDSERKERAEVMYGLTAKFEQDGTCRWSNYEQDYFLWGSTHSTAEYDLTDVSCTTLENDVCVNVQPMANYREDKMVEVVYSLFTDQDNALMNELFNHQQWVIVH